VVAISRGLEYRYVVSETLLRRNDDSSPLDPSETPRLTLMTCAGTWNPITRDYSDRIWVVAVPPELAEATSRAQAQGDAARMGPGERPAAEAVLSATPTPWASAPTAGPVAPAPTVLPGPIAALAGSLPDLSRPSLRPERRRPLAARGSAIPGPGRPARAGLTIEAPLSRANVPPRLVIRGRRQRPLDQSGQAWLLVRARQPGARWYVYPDELLVGPDGTWQADLTLGGGPGLRHELRIGVVDAETAAALSRQVATRPNQPLDQLPAGFWPEADRIVTRR
jgi:hypothetical protein